MFKTKPKQQKNQKVSKSFSHNMIDSYYKTTKQTHFKIYLNSGVNQFDQQQQNTYASSIDVNNCQQFLDSLVKRFSSIYQLDHKAFEWKQKVQGLAKAGKEIIKIIDKLKLQLREFHQTKTNLENIQAQNQKIQQQYQKLKHQYLSLKQASNTQHIAYQESLKFKRRLQLLQEKSHLLQQKNHEIVTIQLKNQHLITQNQQLKNRIEELTKQNSQQKLYLKKIKDTCFSQSTIKDMLQNLQTQPQNQVQILNQQTQHSLPSQSIFQSQVLLNPSISSTIISYLCPKAFTSLLSLTKTIRFFLFHTPEVIHASFRSIIGYKNFQIAYFHRHINHFQQQLKKIPQQIIQSTFYQFNVLKENVGGDFFAILNLCANIFQGKFNKQTALIMSKSVKEYVESKQILHYVEQPKEQEIFLKINKELVKQFFQQRKLKKQQIMVQIQQMTQKISLTQSLYSVDSQTLTNLHQTIIRHFTILFVLAKHLFSESRNLQHLNKFLLSQLNSITKFKIEKQYDLEDIKAELEASNKMNLFLSDKGNRSQERVLRQTKQQLDTQKHVGKLTQSIKVEQQKAKKLQNQINDKNHEINQIKQKYIQLKSLYNLSKEKYNRLISQLGTVKETILKIK